jgi:hypothetical protein
MTRIDFLVWDLSGAPPLQVPGNIFHRFCYWRDQILWKNFLDVLSGGIDMNGLLFDASHVKVYLCAGGTK